jgi:hypothetical protein
MVQTSAGFLAGLAVTLSLGAVHMGSADQAVGHDQTAAAVHRAVKSDLGTVLSSLSSHTSSRTVSVRLESLPSMSIVFRIPGSSGQEVGDRITKRGLNRAPPRPVKRTIACETVVSTLTDVAKRLEPGRCVT